MHGAAEVAAWPERLRPAGKPVKSLQISEAERPPRKRCGQSAAGFVDRGHPFHPVERDKPQSGAEYDRDVIDESRHFSDRTAELDDAARHHREVADAALDPNLSDEQLRNLADVSDWIEWQSRALMHRDGCQTRPEVISCAWEMARESDGRWPLRTILRFAHRRVKERRGDRFGSRTYAIEHSPRHGRAELDVAELFSDRANPAEIGAFRIDWNAWLDRLTPTKRTIATMLGEGHTVAEIASVLGLDGGHVRRLRGELRDDVGDFSDPR